MKAQTNPRKAVRTAPKFNVYLLRLVYTLMFFVLGKDAWTHIFSHDGAWEPNHAMAWCVWSAFATLAGIGIVRPLRMLPILLLEIFYKVLWLIIVAYPLWYKGTLWNSPEAGATIAFLWVLLPIVAVPWGYVCSTLFAPDNADAHHDSDEASHRFDRMRMLVSRRQFPWMTRPPAIPRSRPP